MQSNINNNKKGGGTMKNVSFVTLILIAGLIAALLYLYVQVTPIIREPQIWYYVDQQTGVNYVVVGGEAIIPRLTQSGELYITR